MTIRRGAEWGESVDRPDGLVTAATDAELAVLATSDRRVAISLTGGDLHRSLGSPGSRPVMQRLPLDLLMVTLDGVQHHAVAHVLARRSWWRGPILAVMNVDQLGGWNVAPRAHPNDGRFDVVEVSASMPVRDRIQAKGRLVQGTHVPHPDIEVTTSTARDWTFERATRVWIDGVDVGDCTRLSVQIRPDAICVHL